MENNNLNVIPLHVEPKTVRETYKKQAITVTYIPENESWQWDVEFTARLQFDGMEHSEKRALDRARRYVDKLLEG